MKKIIHLYSRSYDAYFPSPDSDYYYLAGWSSAVARRTLKYTDEYVIENWRTEVKVHKPVMRIIEDVVCRLFPATYVRHFGDWSPSLMSALASERRHNRILIHNSCIHKNPLYTIAKWFDDVPIVAQSHGDIPALLRYRQKRKPSTLLLSLLEKSLLKRIDHFFVLSKEHRDFLCHFIRGARVTQQTMGVDFDQFRPIDRKTARKALGMSTRGKIALYVGRFYKLRGVDLILRIFKNLQRQFNVEFVLVGGNRSDELYDAVKCSGIRFYDYIPHGQMPFYLSAADVFVNPSFVSPFSGIGIAVVESLACSTPVVSTSLKDWPGDDYEEVGQKPNRPEELVECIMKVIESASCYQQCRVLAREYYDWENIIMNTIYVYERLFTSYYG